MLTISCIFFAQSILSFSSAKFFLKGILISSLFDPDKAFMLKYTKIKIK